jgi:hypothetical protein
MANASTARKHTWSDEAIGAGADDVVPGSTDDVMEITDDMLMEVSDDEPPPLPANQSYRVG